MSKVRSFLGFANYFRRFIQHYAEIARPLDKVTGKRSTFSWNQERESAFRDLKTALIQAPVLRLNDVAKQFKVHADASNSVIRAVLLQELNEGWHPVACVSRKLKPAERNHTITEKETVAVVYQCPEILETLPFQTFRSVHRQLGCCILTITTMSVRRYSDGSVHFVFRRTKICFGEAKAFLRGSEGMLPGET